MKIVQLSTGDMGGAGIAAKNLHHALLKHSINSTFISKTNLDTSLKNNIILTSPQKNNFGNRIKNTIVKRLPFLDNSLEYRYLKGQKKGFEYFSFPYSDSDLISQNIPQINNADIIHLHWIADNFIDYKDALSFKNKKFAWTLHDMNPFTGGCHHSDACMKFTQSCNACFQLEGTKNSNITSEILNYKSEALKHLSDEQLVVITPSSWLGKLSSQSKCFGRFEHIVIPNIINFPKNELEYSSLRKEFGILENEIVLLFVAHSVDNVRKGAYTLEIALEQLENKSKIHLFSVGQKQINMFKDIKLTEFGFVKDVNLMQKLYSVADAFLLPSMAENFPNTIVESLLCGTPVIASNVGGIPEQINNRNGILVQKNDSEEWVKTLTDFVFGKYNFNREQIRKEAQQAYNTENNTEKHLQVYSKLLNG